jgi:hypothetical protein
VAPPPERPPDAQTTACPCGRGDVPAQLAGQRPLLARAATGDREAFAQLYDAQVEGVYRYLLAWTGNRSEAADLTSRVFHSALAWLPPTAAGGVEAGAWLTAMSRDAVSERPGSGRDAGPAGDPVAALARLPDSEREVLVLRLLCGHTLDHTAHLSGYSRRAVLGLQLAACLAVAERAGGTAAPRGASAEEFERRLDPSEIAPTAPDPALSAALSAARGLRLAAARAVAPDPEFVASLRHELMVTEPSLPRPAPAPALPDPAPALPHPVRARVPRWGSVAQRRVRGPGLSTALRGISPRRRPWMSTAVATVGIVVLLALRASGEPAAPPRCGGGACPVSTTVAAAAGVGNLGTPLTTVVEASTTTSTAAVVDQVPATSAPRTSASAPPTTRPVPAAAPPSTRVPRPTTTRASTTTAPAATVASTTTTVAAPTT